MSIIKFANSGYTSQVYPKHQKFIVCSSSVIAKKVINVEVIDKVHIKCPYFVM